MRLLGIEEKKFRTLKEWKRELCESEKMPRLSFLFPNKKKTFQRILRNIKEYAKKREVHIKEEKDITMDNLKNW